MDILEGEDRAVLARNQTEGSRRVNYPEVAEDRVLLPCGQVTLDHLVKTPAPPASRHYLISSCEEDGNKPEEPALRREGYRHYLADDILWLCLCLFTAR